MQASGWVRGSQRNGEGTGKSTTTETTIWGCERTWKITSMAWKKERENLGNNSKSLCKESVLKGENVEKGK